MACPDEGKAESSGRSQSKEEGSELVHRQKGQSQLKAPFRPPRRTIADFVQKSRQFKERDPQAASPLQKEKARSLSLSNLQNFLKRLFQKVPKACSNFAPILGGIS